MNFKKLLFASVIVLSANAAIAQVDSKVASHSVTISIPEFALLDLESLTGTTISLAGTASTEAGLPMNFEDAKDESIYMNYSSIVSGTSTRNVSVAITGLNAVPAGLKLTVLAGTATNDGAGTKGTAIATAQTITTDPTIIVSGIGSAYTGDGATKGRKLTYQLGLSDTVADYADLDSDISAELTITYTLSDI